MALSIGKRNSFTDLLKDGYKHLQGLEDAVFSNIKACNELTTITRTSMGPNGKNKIVLNHLEKMFLTNDASTILSEMEVVHPAAKLLILASRQQQVEMGGYTNFVLAFGGELLMLAEDLLRMGIKVSDVIEGYEMALKETMNILPSTTISSITNFHDEKELSKIVLSAVSTKQYGLESVLVPLIVKACIGAMPQDPSNFNVDFLRCVKIPGASVYDSVIVNGMVFEREPETKVKSAIKPKIAVFSCPIDITTTETKGTVLLHDAQEILSFSKGEEMGCEKLIKELAESGFSVLVTNGSVGDLMLHFANRYGLMIVKILSKFDLKRLCKAIGAVPSPKFGLISDEDAGYCDSVEGEEIGSVRCTVFRKEGELSKSISIVLRASTTNKLDDVERAIDSGIAVVKAATRDPRLVAGAGAIEIELCKGLEGYGERTSGLSQYAIMKYAEAFQVIPRTLADNAGQNSLETITQLMAAHQSGKISAGVDVEDDVGGESIDAEKEGIYDLLAAKGTAIQLATEAALTVLRVDQIIMSKMAGGPKPRAASRPDSDE